MTTRSSRTSSCSTSASSWLRCSAPYLARTCSTELPVRCLSTSSVSRKRQPSRLAARCPTIVFPAPGNPVRNMRCIGNNCPSRLGSYLASLISSHGLENHILTRCLRSKACVCFCTSLVLFSTEIDSLNDRIFQEFCRASTQGHLTSFQDDAVMRDPQCHVRILFNQQNRESMFAIQAFQQSKDLFDEKWG